MIPPLIKDSLDRYLDRGIAPGSCVSAILANDLFDAFGRADDVTAANMLYIVRYIYTTLPVQSYGSRETVSKWIRLGGKNGLLETAQ